MHLFATSTAEQFLDLGTKAGIVAVDSAQSGLDGDIDHRR